VSLARAIETGDLAELPSRRDEDWRWTDLRGLLRTLPPKAGPLAANSIPAGPFQADEEVLVINGQGPSDIHIEAGEARVIALRLVSVGDVAYACRLNVSLGEGAALTLLESYESSADGHAAEIDLEVAVGPGARLERIVLAGDAAGAVLVSCADVGLSPWASLAQTVLTCGARRQRLETRVSHPGEGAAVRLDGVYLLADQRHADLTTVVTHAGAGGATEQLAKGVATDQARGVFQGRIVVAPGADRTNARMGHHALILSDRAEIDAKPELEIFADDVSCSHGNTVGALDEAALFYAQQRGVPEPEARAMLTAAFVGEVIDRIEFEGARDVARRWAAQRLGASDEL